MKKVVMAKGGKVSKDFKVGDNVIYTDATNGKWYGRNNVSNIKEGVISNIQEISNKDKKQEIMLKRQRNNIYTQ